MKPPTNNKLPNKCVIEHQFHRVFSFKERVLILCGWNVQADVATAIDVRRGVNAKCMIRLTKSATAEDQQRENHLPEGEEL